ncbi:hypothetical protein [Streptomyces beijiangensis]|uniref:Uncharacterized protein n=1 Tax=Streptomyces beijiangensis TaxID=163361 RepID=A0A939JK60_9ACTN|nr:hypothetical protein [Streptomyces beijiangensis]MBO0514354.1 hypothetical protein [Streptomyces beijiangensis]
MRKLLSVLAIVAAVATGISEFGSDNPKAKESQVLGAGKSEVLEQNTLVNGWW